MRRYFRHFFPSNLVLKISLRYICSSKNLKFPSLVSTLSFLSVALGIATLVVVMSVFNGFRDVLIEKVLGFGSHVSIYPADRDVRVEDVLEDVLELNGVRSAITSIEGQGMLVNRENNFSTGVLVSGLSSDGFMRKAVYFEGLEGCEPGDFGFENNTIFLSYELAQKLGVGVGSDITLISPQVHQTIFGIVPKSKAYKVGCLVSIGMYQYDEVYSFLPFDRAKSFFGSSAGTSKIEIILHDPMMASGIANEIRSRISSSRYNVSDWKSENQNFIQALQVQRNVMIMILFLFICVGIFAIFSNLLLMVKEKQKSIAVLRSMGIRSYEIGQVFFVSGLIVGVSGLIVGVLIGVGFAANIQRIEAFLSNLFGVELFNPTVYFLSNLPSRVCAADVTIVAVCTFVLAILASILPAIKASKQLPAEILRYF